MALLFGVAAGVSPCLALHATIAHGEDSHHHAAEHVTPPGLHGPGHAHGGHEHPVLRVTSSRIQYRSDVRGDVATYVDAVILSPRCETDCGPLRASISRPPHLRHPLSVTNVLRI